MATSFGLRCTYFLRTSRPNKEGNFPIVFRISYKGDRRDIFTGFYSRPDQWDSNQQRVLGKGRHPEMINEKLYKHLLKSNTCYERLELAGESFTIDDVVDEIYHRENQTMHLGDYMKNREKEIELKKGNELTKATCQKYLRVSRFLMDYLKNEKREKDRMLSKIDIDLLEGFYSYLMGRRGIKNNTAVKYVTALRTILMPALRSEQIKKNPFLQFRPKVKPIPKIFLSDEEIATLEGYETKSTDLERIRDQFLFCCYTGLCYSDFQQLSRKHFELSREGGYFLRKTRQKTGIEFVIPLIPAALRILKKYSQTDDPRDFSWQVSSNQKMNMRLKKIGENCNLVKTLHMHMARHTFATTIVLANGVSIETLSSMMGHSNISQTQHYAKNGSRRINHEMQAVINIYK